MGIMETLGIVGGLVVLVLMAVGPALVSLNERYPVEERKPDHAGKSLLDRRPHLLNRPTATHH